MKELLKFEGSMHKLHGVVFPVMNYEAEPCLTLGGNRPYIEIGGQKAYEGDFVTSNFVIIRSPYVKVNVDAIPKAEFSPAKSLYDMFMEPEHFANADPYRLLKLTPNPPSFGDIAMDIRKAFSEVKNPRERYVLADLLKRELDKLTENDRI